MNALVYVDIDQGPFSKFSPPSLVIMHNGSIMDVSPNDHVLLFTFREFMLIVDVW